MSMTLRIPTNQTMPQISHIPQLNSMAHKDWVLTDRPKSAW